MSIEWAGERRKFKNPKAISETEIFRDLLRRVKVANRLLLKIDKMPVAGEAEMEDIRRASEVEIRESRLRYWGKRLLPEVSILPQRIGQLVKKINFEEKLTSSERQIFESYIRRRLAILKFATEKRLVMAELRKRLVDIDKGRDYEEGEKRKRKAIKYDSAQNLLFVEHRGKKIPLTLDDISADSEWGILYYPDESVPPKLWRKIRKRSDIAEARKKIESLFNEELVKIAGIPLPTSAIPLEQLGKIIQKNPGSAANGIIAERMVKTLLMRHERGLLGQSFKIESCNGFEDAELKYDFKIIFTEKTRGVAVEGENMPREEYVARKKLIGVQFTTSANPKNLIKKAEQIEKAREKIEEIVGTDIYKIKRPVDEIILLSVPFDGYVSCFRQWEREGRPPGGPEQFLTKEQQQKIYESAIANFN